MKKGAGALVGFMVVALLAAAFVPTIFSSNAEGQYPEAIQTAVAAQPTTTAETLTLANKPVKADSQVITVNTTPVAETTDYTIVDSTGVVTFTLAAVDPDDAISATYNWERIGGTSGLIWAVIPLIAVVGVLFWFIRRGGVSKGI